MDEKQDKEAGTEVEKRTKQKNEKRRIEEKKCKKSTTLLIHKQIHKIRRYTNINIETILKRKTMIDDC